MQVEKRKVLLAAGVTVLIAAAAYGVFVKISRPAPAPSAPVPSDQAQPATEADATTAPGDEEDDGLTYINNEYGFEFYLPDGWKGYTVVTSQWEGYATAETKGKTPYAKGPLISLRHPLWTTENPRQDIPIMVIKASDWQDLKDGKFHIGAAPVPPTKLGFNGHFAFAVPARYNYAFLTGYEEVEQILSREPLQAFWRMKEGVE
jgi:hypothetical protein